MRERCRRLGTSQARLRPEPFLAFIDLPEFAGTGVTRLEEISVEAADQRDICGVEPDDTLVARVDMPVPAHRRREDQIAVAHFAAAAIDDGCRAVRAGGETDRREGVA